MPRPDEKEHQIDTVAQDVVGAAQEILTLVQTILPFDQHT